MSRITTHINTHIDPMTTQNVLRNLGLAIDEIRLVRLINNLSDQKNPRRRIYRKFELSFLKKCLCSVRKLADTE